MSLILLLGCAVSTADAWAAATAPGLSLREGLRLCGAAGDRAEACRAEVVRAHPQAELGDCAALSAGRWRSECAFAVAERHASAGERFLALAACGMAGSYYGECTYHAWAYDMQHAVGLGGRANGVLEKGRALVAWWSQLQTVAGDPETQMWNDWWYFALKAHAPARLADCAELSEPDGARCERGTLAFVERAVAVALGDSPLPPRQRSRACRGDIEALEAALPGLYDSDPALVAPALAGRERGCQPKGAGVETGRPWNPIFLEHRRWAGG